MPATITAPEVGLLVDMTLRTIEHLFYAKTTARNVTNRFRATLEALRRGEDPSLGMIDADLAMLAALSRRLDQMDQLADAVRAAAAKLRPAAARG